MWKFFQDLAKISLISPRSWKIMLRFLRLHHECWVHSTISPRSCGDSRACTAKVETTPRSRLSHLYKQACAEILEPAPRKLRSIQDLAYLADTNKISPRFSRSHREGWDHSEISENLAKILEVAPRRLRSFQDLRKSCWDSPGRTEMVETIWAEIRISLTKIAPRFALSSRKNFHRGYDIMKKWMVGWYIFTIQVVWSQGQNVSLAEKLLEFLVHKKNTCSINITSTISFRV